MRKLLVPESAVRKAVRAWLDAKHIVHIPIESRVPFRKDGKVLFRMEQARDKGCADFIAFAGMYAAGRRSRTWVIPVAIETKSSIGKQSDAQKAWSEWWTSHGFVYILARSVDDVEKAWPL